MKPMTQQNYYQASAGPAESYPAASAHGEVEVAIVGGGYAGLATALGLAERGVHGVCLLEAEQLGFGASGRNGGFVFAGFSLSEAELLRQLGVDHARRLYAATQRAVALVRQRIQRYQIDCDLVDQGVIWANWFRDPELLRSRQALLANAFASHWQRLSVDELHQRIASARYHGGLFEADALHLHPLKWARGLGRAAAAQGVAIHEQSPVNRLQKVAGRWQLGTQSGTLIRARQVVLCCGGYLAGLHPRIDRSVLPVATYVMATEPLGNQLEACFPGTRAAVYDSRFAFDYYRPLLDTRLLWGGRISVLDRSAAAVARLLRGDMMQVFPQLADVKIDFAWSGLMSYARHEMPQVGQIEPGLWCAQAFGGHGLATTLAAGEVIAAAIAEHDPAIQDYAAFGLPWAGKPFGYAAAQLSYSWMQWRDRFKDFRESRLAR
ncbi:MAG: FAD-dependent oxidoreductase [Lysobacterales bacterium CG02_land_8_20_14_3_00_62_12]|nr:MAG: FAD-dependent oxidoreductase [Xanthomonadales bacterium CG02_land_8_20_14_3_00_62_12]